MKIQEIIIIDKETREVIVQIPLNDNETPLLLKKGLELKVSYDKSFKTKNKKGLLVLNEEVPKTMTDLKRKKERIDSRKDKK